MSWVTLGLRKSKLKDDINNYNYRLMQISSEKERIYTELSRAQKSLQTFYDYNLSVIENTYNQNYQQIGKIYSDGVVRNGAGEVVYDFTGLTLFNSELSKNLSKGYAGTFKDSDNLRLGGEYTDLARMNLDGFDTTTRQFLNAADGQDIAYYLNETKFKERQEDLKKYFEDTNDRLQEQADKRSKELENEQIQVETQLQAAQAEYDSISSALTSDIKSNAIKLSS